MKNQIIQFAKSHLVVILVFIAITLIYFYPTIEGKVLEQYDLKNAMGMSQELRKYHEETGEYAQWTNSIFSGMPAFHVGPTGAKPTIYSYINKILTFNLGFSNPLSIFFIYLLGFYILLISLKVNHWQSMIGAIAFAFSSYNMIILSVGHINKAWAIGYMAPVIGGILLTYRGKYLAGALLFMIGLGMQVRSNHLQITYYLIIISLIIVLTKLFFAIHEKKIKNFTFVSAILIISALISILPNFSTLWINYAIVDQSTRGPSELIHQQEEKTSGLDRSYVLAWSYGPAETLSLMIPNIKGGGTMALEENEKALSKVDERYRDVIANQNHYWGEKTYTGGPVYAGSIIVFLFMLGLFFIRGSFFWWILISTILSILLAWGRHFPGLSNFFLDYIPLYAKFRTVEMILVIASLTIPLMAMIVLKDILNNPRIIEKNTKKFLLAFVFTGGLGLLFFLFPQLFSFFSDREQESFNAQIAGSTPAVAQQLRDILHELENARKYIFRYDAIRSFFFISASFILIWYFAKQKIKASYFLFGLGILILIDMWGVDKRYLNKDNFQSKRKNEAFFSKTPSDEYILADPDPHFRVLNLARNTFNEATTSYYHKSIGGYHGAKLQRYQDLIDFHISNNIQNIIEILQTQPDQQEIDTVLQNQQVLNMLNTKYIIYNLSARPILNKQAFGNAWFVRNIRIVDNANEEILMLNKIDLKNTAVIDKRFSNLLSPAVMDKESLSGNIYLTEYTPGKLTYKSETENEQLAVFSEIFYDEGWNVTIDGKPAELLRANYVLRALVVPPGKHTIEMSFKFKPFIIGEKISLAGSFLVFFILLASAVYAIIQARKHNHA